MRADRQTDKQTDILITILCNPPVGKVTTITTYFHLLSSSTRSDVFDVSSTWKRSMSIFVIRQCNVIPTYTTEHYLVSTDLISSELWLVTATVYWVSSTHTAQFVMDVYNHSVLDSDETRDYFNATAWNWNTFAHSTPCRVSVQRPAIKSEGGCFLDSIT